MSTETMYVGEHRVEISENGVWVYPRDRGRGRYYGNETSVAKSVRQGNVEDFKRPRFYKEGHHEPVYYLRDAEGKVGVPPEPGLPIPDGSTLFEATSLQEIDKISREMNLELAEQFRDEGEFTEMVDYVMGDPRKVLAQNLLNPKSNLERDLIPMLLDVLDGSADERTRAKTQLFFRGRES